MALVDDVRGFKAESVPQPNGFLEVMAQLKCPFDLEVGAGVGHFSIDHSLKNPTQQVVAVEKTSEKYRKFLDNYEAAGKPQNLVPIHGNVVNWLAPLSDRGVIRNVFILYPNPYPKKGQANKRFMNMPFFNHLTELMVTSGRLLHVTNEKWLHDEVKLKVLDTGFFSIESENEFNSSICPRTLFEKKYLARGEICYEVEFLKLDQK